MVKKQYRENALFAILMVLLLATGIKLHATITAQNSPTHHLVVFVHGTLTTMPSLSALKFMWINPGQRAGASLRGWYRNQTRLSSFRSRIPMGPLGFHNVDDAVGHTAATKEITNLLEQALRKSSIHNSSSDNYSFYTFGWEGELDSSCRKNAGRLLHDALISQVARVRQADCNNKVTITIFAHSHGGNVALHMADWCDIAQKQLQVDSLVLLGTPIQSETKHLAQASCFKEVLNIYSHGDMIQTLDILSSDGPAPERKIPKNADTTATITNMAIEVGGYQPNHTELWLLGPAYYWVKKLYRPQLPIYPFPVSVFVPFIKNFIIGTNCQGVDLTLKIERWGCGNYSLEGRTSGDSTAKSQKRWFKFCSH